MFIASTGNTTNSTACGEHEFKCENDNCVSQVVLCDGENNCGDYSDENKCSKCEVFKMHSKFKLLS